LQVLLSLVQLLQSLAQLSSSELPPSPASLDSVSCALLLCMLPQLLGQLLSFRHDILVEACACAPNFSSQLPRFHYLSR
jgi:hypothetical protein